MIKLVVLFAFLAVGQAGVIAPGVPAHPVIAHPLPVAVSHSAIIRPAPIVHAAPIIHPAPIVHAAPIVPVVRHAPIISVHH